MGDNIVKCDNRIADDRYRLRSDKRGLTFFSQQSDGCLLIDKCDFSYLVVDAGQLLQELCRVNTQFYTEKGICYFEFDTESNVLYDERGNKLCCASRVEVGNAEDSPNVIRYDVIDGACLLIRTCESVIDAEYEIESRVLSAFRGLNIAICNESHAWYCIRESRIRYAAEKGFDWLFILRRTDETSKLGGYARIYRCPAQELLILIESNILGLAAGGHCLYIKYNSGAMYADVNCRDRVHQFLPVKYKELNSLIRRVPTDSQLP